MKLLLIICFSFVSTQLAIGQIRLSPTKLEDLSNRAFDQMRVFLENVPVIARGNESLEVRLAGIKSTLSIFSNDAIIQEENKYSRKIKKWKPKKYLSALLERSENTPIVISYEIIDDLLPNEIKEKKHKDGTISYFGKMVFRQYYCKLKPIVERMEIVASNMNVNCSYFDITDKVVKFEIVVDESIKGRYWITRISEILVLRVFE